MKRKTLALLLGLCLFAAILMAGSCRRDPLDLPAPDPQPTQPLP